MKNVNLPVDNVELFRSGKMSKQLVGALTVCGEGQVIFGLIRSTTETNVVQVLPLEDLSVIVVIIE